MSLRDKNKKALVSTDKEADKKSGSLRKKTGAIAKPSGKGLKAVQKVAARNIASNTGNLGFIIDATGSRSSNWKEAQSIQAGMFDTVSSLGRMNLRLVHFGGSIVTDHGWQNDSKVVSDHMAEVSCKGGATQIIESIHKFLDDKNHKGENDERANSIIIVGDSFEESEDELIDLAEQLKVRNIRVFTFLDGNNIYAERAFKEISKITGGAFAKFGPDMPLKDLCEGVALMSVGGESALSRLENAAAKQLLLEAKPK